MPENEVVLNAQNFEDEVLKSDKPVLVDMWADWCAPCKMISPVVTQIADENAGKAKVCKLELVEDNLPIAQKYQVTSIPTLLLFKDGEEKERIVGVVFKPKIQEMIDKYA